MTTLGDLVPLIYFLHLLFCHSEGDDSRNGDQWLWVKQYFDSADLIAYGTYQILWFQIIFQLRTKGDGI